MKYMMKYQPHSPNTASALQIHSDACIATGRQKQGVRCLRDAEQIMRESLGPDAPQTLQVQEKLRRLEESVTTK